MRREVNYGCPVQGCGSPYLTYHHFAPPFRDFDEDQVHDTAGIIALCHTDATQADGGVYTDDQLRAMKSAPLLLGPGVRGRLAWLRREIVLVAGGMLAFKPSVLLQVDGRSVIWVSRSEEGDVLLNIDLPDAQGNPAFKMEDNDWLVEGKIDDFEAPPQGRLLSLRAEDRGIRLDLVFQSMTANQRQTWISERGPGVAEANPRACDNESNAVAGRLSVSRNSWLKKIL